MIGTLYRHDPLNMAPAVATLLKEANMFNLPSLLWMLNSVHSKETTTPPLPNEVSAALLTRLERPQAAMFAVPSELFNTCARLLPDALAVQMWQSHWGSWTPQGRTALAEALSLGTYTTETARVGARRNLLQLMSDAQYSVRRAAYRSMALIDLHLLYLLSGAWLAAPSMELRRRAAEALSWLSETQSPEKEIRVKLLERLATDPDLQIREVVLRSEKEQRERTWMNTYLARIRSTYGKGNQFLLRSWRYAHALTKLGDDTVIAQLQADLSTRKLDLHERHWLRWIISKTQESWKKTNDQWPSAWYTWNGDVIYEQGQFTTSGGTVYTGKCCLYCLSKSTVVEEANWGGAFRLDKPAMTSKGEVVTLKLADRHEGQATIIERLGEIWLFAGAKKLTIGTVWEY